MTTLPCRHCGASLTWTTTQLETHRLMVLRGEHAACACDDDCAILSPRWELAELDEILGDGVALRERAEVRS